MISICTLKFSCESILKPQELIFKSYIDSRKLSLEWKKANVVLVPKKDKQLKENYFSISLLPICGKILERLIYNTMLEFFTCNKLNSSNQSGFKPGDSCIKQLFCITHDIQKPFNDALETKAVFLEISKAFDKVWHEGLHKNLSKMEYHVIFLISSHIFLSLRKRRIVLNGQHSAWVNTEAGVLQGSILGPLVFLIYINDSSDDLMSNQKLFANNTFLFSVIQNINSTEPI